MADVLDSPIEQKNIIYSELISYDNCTNKGEIIIESAKGAYQKVENTQTNLNLNQTTFVKQPILNQLHYAHFYWTLKENSKGIFGNLRRLVFKYHYLFFPGYCILSFIFILGILILSFLNKSDIQSFSGTLYTIENNMNAQSISDIVVIPTGNSCPKEYSLMSLGIWPGIDEYCYCGNSIFSSEYYPGVCPSKRKYIGCYTINSRSSQNYYTWRNRSFCAKYIIASKSLMNCPMGYTACYIGGCYPSNDSCPITNITYNSSISSISYIKDRHSTPFIGLQISMNGPPCLENTRAPAYTNYPPLRSLKPIGCQRIDPSANYSIDQYDQLTFLTDNNMSDLIEILGYNDSIQGSKANLIMIQKYQMKNSTFCLALTPGCFISVQYTIHDYLGNFFGLSLGTIICLLIFIFGYSVTLRMQNDDKCLKNKENYSIILQYIILLGLNINSVIIVFLLELILIIKHMEEKDAVSLCINEFNQIISHECFDESITNSLEYFLNLWKDKTQFIIELAAITLIISAMSMPLHLIYAIFYFKKKSNRQNLNIRYYKVQLDNDQCHSIALLAHSRSIYSAKIIQLIVLYFRFFIIPKKNLIYIFVFGVFISAKLQLSELVYQTSLCYQLLDNNYIFFLNVHQMQYVLELCSIAQTYMIN